jgi:hypothetical protein
MLVEFMLSNIVKKLGSEMEEKLLIENTGGQAKRYNKVHHRDDGFFQGVLGDWVLHSSG